MFKCDIKIKEFSIGNFTPLANAFDKFFKTFVYNKTNTIFKKIINLFYSTYFLITILSPSTSHCNTSPFFNSNVSRIVAGIVVVKDPLINCILVNFGIMLRPPIVFNGYLNICI